MPPFFWSRKGALLSELKNCILALLVDSPQLVLTVPLREWSFTAVNVFLYNTQPTHSIRQYFFTSSSHQVLLSYLVKARLK